VCTLGLAKRASKSAVFFMEFKRMSDKLIGKLEAILDSTIDVLTRDGKPFYLDSKETVEMLKERGFQAEPSGTGWMVYKPHQTRDLLAELKEVDSDWDKNLREFCLKTGFKYTAPKWHLVCKDWS
jgi:hypothetical protein